MFQPDIPLKTIKMRESLCVLLSQNGIDTANQLLDMTDENLARCHGVGKIKRVEITQLISDLKTGNFQRQDPDKKKEKPVITSEPIITKCGIDPETPLRKLDIPIWMVNMFGRNGFSTAGDLIGYSMLDLFRLRGLGKTRTQYAADILREIGDGTIKPNREPQPQSRSAKPKETPVTLADFLDSIDLPDLQDQLRLRLHGTSLLELAERYHATKQWIHARCFTAFRKAPPIIERKYLPVFSRYRMNKEEFCEIFQEDETVFYYLQFFCGVNQKLRRLPLSDIVYDTLVDPVLQRPVLKYIHELQYVNIDGQMILKTRKTLVEYAITKFAKHRISVEDFQKQYHAFLDTLGLQDDKTLRCDSIQTFCNSFYGASNIIFGGAASIRHYDYMGRNYKALFSGLNLRDYAGQTVSSDKLFFAHPDLMREFDVETGHELHWLLRQTYDEQHIQYIRFGKMPALIFGGGSKTVG